MSSFFTDTILGIIMLNVFSTFVFTFVLLKFFRPTIIISDLICYQFFNKDNAYYYVFKIVNNSYFDLYNIELKLHLQTPELVNNGDKINYRVSPIKINLENLDVISRYKRKKGYGDHAFLIRTKHNILEDISKENTSIVLSVLGRHGFSNLQRMVTKTYNHKNLIKKDYEFRFGKSIDVIEK